MVEEKFLIDANAFITPYKFYYAFDLIPEYLKRLKESTKTGRIVLLDMVKAEIGRDKDNPADWIDEQKGTH